MEFKVDVSHAMQGLDDFTMRLSSLLVESDEAAKEAVYVGAGILADEVRKNLKANIEDPASAAKNGKSAFKRLHQKSTGDLEKGFGITPIKIGHDGNWNAKIGFSGYDSKGVPNQLKARAKESGTTKLRKRPFVRPALNAKRAAAMDAMREKVSDRIKGITE